MAKRRKEHDAASSKFEPGKKKTTGRTVLTVLGTLALVCALAFAIFCVYFYNWVKTDMSSQEPINLEEFSLNQTSAIVYQDSQTKEWKVLQALYAEENRIWTNYEDMPTDLIFACVAIEDKRFFEHSGVDWVRTMYACANMFIGQSSFGGSTLTQQLVKNLTEEDEVTVRRKLTEIYRALQLEEDYEKEEILEMYLNTIYLGEGCYGVQSASKIYFGKDVADLTLAECASLIGITNNPSAYDPYIYPENNRDRQLIILSQMKSQGYISEAEYNEAVNQEMVFQSASSAGDDDGGYYSYFVDQVIRDVVAELMQQTGYSYETAYAMITSGGYTIYSTLDMDIQSSLEDVFENTKNLPETESSQQLQGGMVITDNETGDIVAMVGGTGKKTGSLTYNRATQSYLQPGSIIKTVGLYSLALEKGLITPAAVMDDTPYSFTDASAWPVNANGMYQGLVDMRTSVAKSLNTVAVKLVNELTPQACLEYARDVMGLATLVNENSEYTDATLWSMALGSLTEGVTIRDMTEAYGSFVNDGVYREGRTFTRVADRHGKTILENEQDTRQALSEKNAWYMTDMMQATVTDGTGTGAALGDMPVAGKTGTTGTTTADYDLWFAGYTPYYTAVVWTGYDTPESIVTTDGSGNPAIALWKKVMKDVHADLDVVEFEEPSYIVECTYCRDSGMLATAACRNDSRGDRTMTGKLALEDVPTEECTNHVLVDFCGASGHMATQYCRQQAGGSIYQKGMLSVERSFPISGIIVQDQQYNRNTTVRDGHVLPATVSAEAQNLYCMTHVEQVEVKTWEDLITEGLSSLFGGDDEEETEDSTDEEETEETEETEDELSVPDVQGDASYGEIVGE